MSQRTTASRTGKDTEKKSATKVTVATKASHSTSETIVLDATDISKIKKDAENAILNDAKITGTLEDSINEYGDAEVRFRKVTDQATLERLNSKPTIKVYRAMSSRWMATAPGAWQKER